MEINKNEQDFITWIGEVLQVEPKESDGVIIFEVGNKKLEIRFDELTTLL